MCGALSLTYLILGMQCQNVSLGYVVQSSQFLDNDKIKSHTFFDYDKYLFSLSSNLV